MSASLRVPRRLARLSFLVLLLVLARTPRASGQMQVTTPGVVEHVAAPGARIEGTIELRNESAREQAVRVYQTDYSFDAAGQSTFAAAGSTARSNARWVALSGTQLTLAAGATTRVGYVITVPTGSTALAGTYWSMVMVETMTAEAAAGRATGRPERARVGVGVAIRHAVQLAVTIDGAPGRTALRLDNAALVAGAAGKGRALVFDASNAGDLAVRPLLKLELIDQAGNRLRRDASQRGLLYPGSSLRQRFELGTLPAGRYEAVIVADTGGDDLFGARFSLTF